MIRLPSIARTVIGSGGKLFDPSQLPGLAAWYSADYGVLSQTTNAASFVAANSESLSCPNNSSLQTGTGSWEISLWINPSSLTEATRGIYLAKSENTSGNTQEFILFRPSLGSSVLRFVVGNAAGNSNVTLDASGVLAATTWIFVSFGFNGTHAFLNVNNTQRATIVSSGVYQSTGALTVGGALSWNEYSSSVIGLVGFWKRNLTSDERTFLYNNGTGRLYADLPTDFKTSLVSYWNLIETSGTRNDSHGTNHLTDNNTVGYAAGPYAIPASDGQTVRRWLDRSGNGRHLDQATLVNQPTFSSSGVVFSLKEIILASQTLPQPLSIFAVAKTASTGGGDNFILSQWTASSTSGRWALYFNVTANKDVYVQRATGADNKRITGQQVNVVQAWTCTIADGAGMSSLSLQVAGETGTSLSVGSGGVGATPTLPLRMGTGTSNVAMTVYEVVLCSGYLASAADIAKVKTYFAKRWGIAL